MSTPIGWARPNGPSVTIRFLPPKRKNGISSPVFSAARVHYFPDQNGRNPGARIPIWCPKDLNHGKWEGNCLVCDHYAEGWRAGPPGNWSGTQQEYEQLLRQIKPTERYYWNIIERDKPEAGPQKFSTGRTIHSIVVKSIVGDPALNLKPMGDVTNVETGRDFLMIREMKNQNTLNNVTYPDYSKSHFLEPSRLSTDEEIAVWSSCLHDLETLHQVTTDQAMKEILTNVFGYYERTNGKKRKPTYRKITEPWEQAW